MRKIALLSLAASLLVGGMAPAALALTDEEVVRAIEKAKEYLIGLQQPNGAWPEQRYHAATLDCGHTEMALFTLVYIGVHPNRDVISKAMDALMARPLDYTYAISMRTMAYAHIQNQLAEPRRSLVRRALITDAMWLVQAQGSHGGWNYTSLGGSAGRYDLSNTQMAILALREAALAGVEIPETVWKRAQDLYFGRQQQDGSWNYGDAGNKHIGGDVPGYGTMTAAGLASIFITMDNLDLASGCPCSGGKSSKVASDFERRIDMCLQWLEKNFTAGGNPKFPDGPASHRLYWLYAVERVGIAAGYKYFGAHNWYREGAEMLVKEQQPNGSWGSIPDTCFATLFLFKGRAPILYNKLEFKSAGDKPGDLKPGDWNNHRRDIANLTTYIEKNKEQMFQWQITSLRAPVEELHDAPLLYITAETVPAFTDEEKKKLRAFTDTGGTILFEASCGNPKVRAFVHEFVKQVWPEWPMKPLGPDHGSFLDPHPLQKRPEILGLTDGIRTFLFYAMDDISCPWQTKAYTGRDYLFRWGINLFSYATDKSLLRSKLADREPAKTTRYNSPVKAGDKNTLRLARVKYPGNGWLTGRNYKGLDLLARNLAQKASVTLKVEENGLAPAELGDREAAYLTGPGELALTDADRQGLKDYLAKGGFLWFEAAAGSLAFDQAFRQLAGEMGWSLNVLPPTHPMVTGKMPNAVGYDLATGVQFRRTLRVARIGRGGAELAGIYQGEKLVGVYSPFDVLFSMTGYDAYGNRGYPVEDAQAVATNIVLYLTDRPSSP